MDREEFVDNRRRRYLAQTLEHLENHVLSLLEGELAEDGELRDAIETHKAHVRRKFQAFATDVTDVMMLGSDTHLNGLAVAALDRLGPEGRPLATRS